MGKSGEEGSDGEGRFLIRIASRLALIFYARIPIHILISHHVIIFFAFSIIYSRPPFCPATLSLYFSAPSSYFFLLVCLCLVRDVRVNIFDAEKSFDIDLGLFPVASSFF